LPAEAAANPWHGMSFVQSLVSEQSPEIPVPGEPAFVPDMSTGDRSERLAKLLEKARALPKVAGVYLMKDVAGRVIYVGKAGRLPDRVSSYFVPSADLGYQKQRLLDFVEDFDTVECEGEWEALLAENRLIKDLKPRFNVRLVDDKTFPYLAITMAEDFPKVFITRSPADPELKGAKIFGPFTAVGALREAMQLLQRVFKYRTCSLEIVEGDEKRKHFRPCILYSIGQCTAPCAAKVSREAYREDVDRFVKFLGASAA
jgi:excinuclease ABC subunit C